MPIYDKLKDVLISALREIAGLSEDEAKKELSALEFELRKLAEKVERGERSLEDAIKEVTKKAEIYSPSAFRQKVRSGVGESCNSFRSYEKPKQKSSKFVKESREGSRKVIPFSELVPIPSTTDLIQKRGFMDYFNQWYRYKSRSALSIYYHFKPVKHIEPIKVVRKKIPGAKKPVPIHAEFEGFEIHYDEITSHFEYIITGDVSKYGRDFVEGLKYGVLTTAVTADMVSTEELERSFCYTMAGLVKSIEDGKKVITEEGLGALFSVLSLAIESCRGMGKTKPRKKHNGLSRGFSKHLYEILAFSKQLTITEDEFIKFVETHKPPEGHVWARTPFGAPPGMLKVYLKKLTPPKYSNTDLERKFEEILNELGFKEGVDYQKQYQLFGYWIDFAFPHLKIAFEPGATYYHKASKWVEGEALEPFGFSPEEVYYPVKPDDVRKDRLLKRNGWIVGWLNENFVKNLSEVKKWVSEIISRRKDF